MVFVRELCRYRASRESWQSMHGFFESLLQYLGPPASMTQWREDDFDNFKFIAHELFLHSVATMLRERRFEGVGFLVGRPYFDAAAARQGGGMVSFSALRSYVGSLDRRNHRLSMRRLSLHADILKQRLTTSSLSFDDLMQADFALYIRDALDCLGSGHRERWYPVTLVFAEMQYKPFELFARSESADFFKDLQGALGPDLKARIDQLFSAWKSGTITLPRWGHVSFDPSRLMGYEKLGRLQ